MIPHLKSVPVRLSYLGCRNYIDISSIDHGFLASLGIDTADLSLGYWSVRLFGQINKHGVLRPGLLESAKCQYEFEYNHVGMEPERHAYSFFESDELITDRRAEPEFCFKEHFWINGSEAFFIKPLTNFRTYNFMVLGRELVKLNTDKIPKVVKSKAWASIAEEDYCRVRMQFQLLNKNFGLLKTDLDSKKLGEIYVRLYEAPEASGAVSAGEEGRPNITR